MLSKRRTVLLKRRNKYNARKTTVDGITFHSKAEAHRWTVLSLLLKAGAIRNLQRQVKYRLEVTTPEGQPKRIGSYIADFVYWQEGRGTVVEDVKGMATQVYKLKKRHVEAQYGLEITEVK